MPAQQKPPTRRRRRAFFAAALAFSGCSADQDTNNSTFRAAFDAITFDPVTCWDTVSGPITQADVIVDGAALAAGDVSLSETELSFTAVMGAEVQLLLYAPESLLGDPPAAAPLTLVSDPVTLTAEDVGAFVRCSEGSPPSDEESEVYNLNIDAISCSCLGVVCEATPAACFASCDAATGYQGSLSSQYALTIELTQDPDNWHIFGAELCMAPSASQPYLVIHTVEPIVDLNSTGILDLSDQTLWPGNCTPLPTSLDLSLFGDASTTVSGTVSLTRGSDGISDDPGTRVSTVDLTCE